MDNEHTVYMLKCKDGSLYTGYTNDLPNRLKVHEQGKGAKYTRGRGPFEIVFKKTFTTKEAAMQEEYRIKQLQRKDKIKLIRQEKEQLGHADTKEF